MFDAYGVAADSLRTRYYRLLGDSTHDPAQRVRRDIGDQPRMSTGRHGAPDTSSTASPVHNSPACEIVVAAANASA